MPLNAEILSVQCQGNPNFIILWVLVEPEFNKEDRKFLIYGTGDMITELNIKFLSTIQIDGLVWHIFERHFPT